MTSASQRIHDLEQKLEKSEAKAKRAYEALERSELRVDQFRRADIIQKLHISQLESIVLQVRNCVTPRVMQKISAEQEPFVENSDG
jgi:hypothetical protein